MNVLRYLRDIPVILRKVIHMSLNVDKLNENLAALTAAITAAAPELAGVAQLKADLATAQAAAQKASDDATAQATADQATIDELTAKVAALTAQLQPQ